MEYYFDVFGCLWGNRSCCATVVGRLEYDDNSENHKVIIDGQSFSWDDLGRMLNAYEGFQFKLMIFDMTDDID